jgi:hypothetical protein
MMSKGYGHYDQCRLEVHMARRGVDFATTVGVIASWALVAAFVIVVGTYAIEKLGGPAYFSIISGQTSGSQGDPTWEMGDDGFGNTVKCVDGTISRSGGVQGACSQHGGVR